MRLQEADFRHHGDKMIPPQQRFGGFGRSLLAGLGVPVENRFGLHPAAEPDGSPSPIEIQSGARSVEASRRASRHSISIPICRISNASAMPSRKWTCWPASASISRHPHMPSRETGAPASMPCCNPGRGFSPAIFWSATRPCGSPRPAVSTVSAVSGRIWPSESARSENARRHDRSRHPSSFRGTCWRVAPDGSLLSGGRNTWGFRGLARPFHRPSSGSALRRTAGGARRSRAHELEPGPGPGQGRDGLFQRLGRRSQDQRLHRLGGRAASGRLRRHPAPGEAVGYRRGGRPGAGGEDRRASGWRLGRSHLDQRRQFRRHEAPGPALRSLHPDAAELSSGGCRGKADHGGGFHRAGGGPRGALGHGPDRVHL